MEPAPRSPKFLCSYSAIDNIFDIQFPGFFAHKDREISIVYTPTGCLGMVIFGNLLIGGADPIRGAPKFRGRVKILMIFARVYYRDFQKCIIVDLMATL